ncbi:MAG: 16S rRNA (uracil(1498)-N(3))-methyltransferase [Rhodobacteraceae bacterium]|nr:16S rRNA (uracil(1498)-N(3))-methyltransferase [Paracoccaceae bacterium]
MEAPKIRLYVDQPLGEGQSVPLDRGQAHYLFGVMRLGLGDRIALFDGRAGEWAAEITQTGKRCGQAVCVAQTKGLQRPPDLWLLFAPIKKARTDFIVEKAAELGAARILPVQTDFTNAERVRADRLRAHAVEAAEQCGGTYVPEVGDLRRLSAVLDAWPNDRRLMFCDEARVGHATDFAAIPDQPDPWAILIGPEGGFSASERDRLHAMVQAVPVSLGPRVLRADTAAVAALALWQARFGDWRR